MSEDNAARSRSVVWSGPREVERIPGYGRGSSPRKEKVTWDVCRRGPSSRSNVAEGGSTDMYAGDRK